MGKRVMELSADVLKKILDNLYDEVVVVDTTVLIQGESGPGRYPFSG